MNYSETLEMLSKFYAECLKFWTYGTENALRDIENLTSNPYSPNGQPIDLDARNDFVKYIREIWQ